MVAKREDDRDEGAAGRGGDAAHEPNSPHADTPNGTPSRAVEESPAVSGAKRKVDAVACARAPCGLVRAMVTLRCRAARTQEDARAAARVAAAVQCGSAGAPRAATYAPLRPPLKRTLARVAAGIANVGQEESNAL